MERYLSAADAAKLSGVSGRRISSMCRNNQIPGACKKGRGWQIPEGSIGQVKGRGAHSSGRELLPLGVGRTSFKELAAGSCYVDKTAMIRELIDSSDEVTLFLRPPRFGKTLTLSMLQAFFEKTEEDTAGCFEHREIWSYGEKYRRLQGKYPVVHLTFKDIAYAGFEDSLKAIRDLVIREFERHPELDSMEGLQKSERRYLQKLRDENLDDKDLSYALRNLTAMLHRIHGTAAVILIDEYDTPVRYAYSRGYYPKMTEFMRRFLSCGLKDNPSLAFGVLTGICRTPEEDLFGGLNNITVNTVLDDRYSRYFGFTEAEVNEMAACYGREDRLPEIRRWYGGYLFGSTSVYNPWSVTNYLNNGCTPKAYWSNTGGSAVIREIIRQTDADMADTLVSLLQGRSIEALVNTSPAYPQSGKDHTLTPSFLLQAGYLTTTEQAEETELGTKVSLCLPNAEVRRAYRTEIAAWLSGSMASNVMPDISKAILAGRPDRLQRALRRYMLDCIDSFGTSAEGFYHGMLLGLAAYLPELYIIRSGREPGEGRFGLRLEPRAGGCPGIIMECKQLRPGDKADLKELAGEAHAQIGKKQYDTDMRSRGIREIIKYGIAFRGKDAAIDME